MDKDEKKSSFSYYGAPLELRGETEYRKSLLRRNLKDGEADLLSRALDCADDPTRLASAAKLFKQAAQAGDELAMYDLGLAYEFGCGVDQDERKAYRCYDKAFKDGVYQSAARLALLLDNGRGTAENHLLAQKYLSKIADFKDPLGMYLEGLHLIFGEGIEVDFQAADICFGRSASAGYLPANLALAHLYLDRRSPLFDPEKGFPWIVAGLEVEYLPMMEYVLRLSYMKEELPLSLSVKQEVLTARTAELGSSYANFILAEQQLIRKPHGEVDFSKVRSLLLKAAALPDPEPEVFFLLGNLCGGDHEEFTDLPSAKAYYQKAYEMGLTDGALGLGDIYFAEKDYRRAVACYQLAAAEESMYGYLKLADCYRSPQVGEVDLEASLHAYEKALELATDVRDRRRIENGIGNAIQAMTNDIERAKEHFQSAADLGDISAAEKLGNYYRKKGDPDSAFRYFSKACEAGSVDALYQVGHFYLEGYGTRVNNSAGYKLLSRAADYGHRDARTLLAVCLLQGIGAGRDPYRAFELLHGNYGFSSENDLYLGACYKFGYGIEKNPEEADRIFELLLLQGAYTREELDKFLVEMAGIEKYTS